MSFGVNPMLRVLARSCRSSQARSVPVAVRVQRRRSLVTSIARASPAATAITRAASTSTQAADFVEPEALDALRRTTPEPGPDYKILIIGAGNINFGSEEGPWNHSKRIEEIFGPRLKVVGLVDPAADRAEAVLTKKRASFAAPAYEETIIYPDIQAAIAELKGHAELQPDAIILGSPPAFRGRSDPSGGRDAEIQLAKAFGSAGVGLFVEKPVSTGTVKEAKEVAAALEASGMVVGVGYMLRYCKAVQEMKKILSENNLKVMMTSARYIMAYEHSLKPAWWNKSVDCGPIVEQATHFADLSRYFGGEVDLASIAAHSVEWYEEPGKLSKLGVDESQIPEDDRIPRFTSASWKYENGAIGHLEHGVSLQGTEFATELAVYADGYLLKLVDPYNNPTLYIRRPGSDVEEVKRFHDDDSFYAELASFVNVADAAKRGKTSEAEAPNSKILSSFKDAVKTYDFTWAIRSASEKSRVPRSGRV